MRPSCKLACHLPSRPPGGAGAQPTGARAWGGGGVCRAGARARRGFSRARWGRALRPLQSASRGGGAGAEETKGEGGGGGGRARTRAAARAGFRSLAGGGGGEGWSGRAAAAAGWALPRAGRRRRRAAAPGSVCSERRKDGSGCTSSCTFTPGGRRRRGRYQQHPPFSLAGKKEKASLVWGVPGAPGPARAHPDSWHRLPRAANFPLSLCRAPPPSPSEDARPPSLFIQPPRGSAPPLPAPPPFSSSANASAAEPPSGPRLPTPPAGLGAAVSAPPDQCKRSAEPANQVPLPLPPRRKWLRADRWGKGDWGVQIWAPGPSFRCAPVSETGFGYPSEPTFDARNAQKSPSRSQP